MKRYLFLIAATPVDWTSFTPEQQAEFMTQHAQFENHLTTHGRLVSTAPLAGAEAATTIRHRDDQLVVSDGPFAETAEVISGYYDAELPDLDSAIAAAALLPHGYAVEIRPAIPTPTPDDQVPEDQAQA
ncbi:YciI family protein [Aestuariimicrobium ganziense]|uniref:YciI family protein n=1 Tax=Aestuariimicrobium ganziense TaxID=2773677 RepID=UPI001942E919|nr:YciI family protein [Aestuariimicrobium ganziense]